MSLTNDLKNSLSDVQICFSCGHEIVNKSTLIFAQGMCFHKYCYEQQSNEIDKNATLEKYPADKNTTFDKSPTFDKYPTFDNYPADKTNLQFIEDEISPLIRINGSNTLQNTELQPADDIMPDLVETEKDFHLTPEHERRGSNNGILGPEIITNKYNDISVFGKKRKPKKVTILEDKLPSVKVEHEDYPEININLKKAEIPNRHPEMNICLECSQQINFSEPTSYLKYGDKNSGFDFEEITKNSFNLVNNFNRMGEIYISNLENINDPDDIKFYIHVSCASSLERKEFNSSNETKPNLGKSENDKIPKEKFDAVMDIMKYKKEEEIVTAINNLTTQIMNMNNKISLLEKKIENKNMVENDEKNRRELFSQQISSQNSLTFSQQISSQNSLTFSPTKPEENSKNFLNIEPLRNSILQLAVLMGHFSNDLFNIEDIINKQGLVSSTVNENLNKLIKTTNEENQNVKKRSDLMVDIIQDVESTLSGKIFEMSEKMELMTKSMKKIETTVEEAKQTLEIAAMSFVTPQTQTK